MGNIFKATLIMRFSPAPPNGGVLTPARLAGFSENYWYPSALTPQQFSTLATKRAAIMCPDCAVLGWRLTPYTFTGNTMSPLRSVVGNQFVPGKFTGETNSPDDTLRMRGQTAGNNQAWTIFLHAIPDDVIESGSYISNNNFVGALAGLVTFFTTSNLGVPPIQWLGRDNSQAVQRVLNVNGGAGTITTATPIPGIALGNSIRLRRVYASPATPIKGSFIVSGIAPVVPGPAVVYTVAGLPQLTTTGPNGFARLDQIATAACASMNAVLLASRKVGRPTLLYHGRRSRTRV